MGEKLRWGILAAGNIAKTFAKGLAGSKTGRLVAVGSRSKEKAEAFAREFGEVRAHGSYEDLLADTDVQAVYVATPHPLHAEWTIKAAEAKKHILCEKPLTLNFAGAMAAVEAAREHDVFLMEAFMYRCHPQTERLVELLRDQVVGEVRLIGATFGFHAGFNPSARLFSGALGGGGILDVGCYAVSLARLVAGVAAGKTIAEPLDVSGTGFLGSTGVDEWAVASLKFPGGIVAQLATSVSVALDNKVHIFGSDGHILLEDPWIPGRDASPSKILVHRKGEKEPQEILIRPDRDLYSIEADTVAEHLAARQAAFPAMTWADSLGNSRTLDRWREAVGLVYPSERFDAPHPPVAGRPLAVRADAPIPSGRIPGLEKKVSRLVMGVDNQRTMASTAVLFDAFFERGGNAFDTAWLYGGGWSERLVGRWIALRGVREKVVILDKGAHTPHCNPADLTRQLLESLDRLGTDYVDIYMMHRDNPQVPVGEFIDVLNEHLAAGRIRAFGGSNWKIERIEAADAYAKKAGKVGLAALSNQFSLARMVEPPWDGCLTSSDARWRSWLKKTQTPLMPWSSQASGFFVRADPADRSDESLARCWYAEDNFERLQRARDLGARKGVAPINIALAYVLAQPFPTFPLIGPRTLEELRVALEALAVSLSPQELSWLNLET